MGDLPCSEQKQRRSAWVGEAEVRWGERLGGEEGGELWSGGCKINTKERHSLLQSSAFVEKKDSQCVI